MKLIRNILSALALVGFVAVVVGVPQVRAGQEECNFCLYNCNELASDGALELGSESCEDRCERLCDGGPPPYGMTVDKFCSNCEIYCPSFGHLVGIYDNCEDRCDIACGSAGLAAASGFRAGDTRAADTKAADDPENTPSEDDDPENTPRSGLFNPLKFESIPELVSGVIKFLTQLAAAVLVVAVLFGAFQIMTAGGSPEKIKQGRNAIIWALIGFGIILIAGGVSVVIVNILGGSDVVGDDAATEGAAITDVEGVLGVIENIARWMFNILMGLGIIFVLLAAYQYLISRGETERISQARRTLTYAIVALVIGFLAGGAAMLVGNLVGVESTTDDGGGGEEDLGMTSQQCINIECGGLVDEELDACRQNCMSLYPSASMTREECIAENCSGLVDQATLCRVTCEGKYPTTAEIDACIESECSGLVDQASLCRVDCEAYPSY